MCCIIFFVIGFDDTNIFWEKWGKMGEKMLPLKQHTFLHFLFFNVFFFCLLKSAASTCRIYLGCFILNSFSVQALPLLKWVALAIAMLPIRFCDPLFLISSTLYADAISAQLTTIHNFIRVIK